MIVKNAAQDLPDCLGSVEGAVNEIVVADTGSQDSSIEIARGAGAKVFSIPWEKDFAKARNRSLSEVTSDWVLMLDADERLDPKASQVLPALLARKDTAGYQVPIRNYLRNLAQKVWDRPAKPNDSAYEPAKAFPAYVDHENVRLFRRDPEIYFTGRVHETVGNRILDTGRKLSRANFFIHHFGMVVDDTVMAKKLLFYRDLGRDKLIEMPNDAQAHLEVGIVELENLGNVEQALQYFERACSLKPRFGVAWFFAGKSQFRLGRFTEAARSLERAESVGHPTAAVAELAGDANYNLGDYDRSCTWYKRGLKRDPGNPSIESKLGLAEARAGNPTAGQGRLRRAIERTPACPDLYDRLVVIEVWLGNLAEAAQAAEAKLTNVPARPEDYVRAASIWAQMKDRPRAVDTLRKGIVIFPNSDLLRAHLCKLETCASAVTPLFADKVNR